MKKEDKEELRKELEKYSEEEQEKMTEIMDNFIKMMAMMGDKDAKIMMLGNEICDLLQIVHELPTHHAAKGDLYQKYEDFYMQLKLEIENFIKDNDIKNRVKKLEEE